MKKLTDEQLKKRNDLNDIYAQSSGAGTWFRYSFGFLITEGVKAIADSAGGYWLIDAIVSYRRKEEHQFWTLLVRGSRAVLIMQEDSGKPFLVKQKISFTDFPQGRWKVWVINKTLMVPNEY